jgi:hypothetical protein
MADKQAVDALMGMVQRLAMEVVELPHHARDERYAIIRDSLRETATNLGLKDPARQAATMADFVRALVTIIEQGGGGRGGAA